jgi:hypothetical protein
MQQIDTSNTRSTHSSSDTQPLLATQPDKSLKSLLDAFSCSTPFSDLSCGAKLLRGACYLFASPFIVAAAAIVATAAVVEFGLKVVFLPIAAIASCVTGDMGDCTGYWAPGTLLPRDTD